MSREHFLLTASNEGGRWIILRRDDAGTSDVFSVAAGSLEARVHFLIETMQTRPGADFTFSTRSLADVQASGLIEDAATVRRAAPGVSLCVMAPKGPPFDPNLWAQSWRDPWGTLSEGTRDTRFRVMTLQEMIRDWFVKQDWRSFAPENPPRPGRLPPARLAPGLASRAAGPA